MDFKAVFTHVSKTSFNWVVTLNGQAFEYHTGFAYAKEKRIKEGLVAVDVSKFDINLKASMIRAVRPMMTRVSKQDCDWLNQLFLVVPSLDMVLESLFLDADCGQYSFDEFCENLGYSNDSISALDSYRACQRNGDKLRKALGAQYETERVRIERISQGA